jgi:hypothetical protein
VVTDNTLITDRNFNGPEGQYVVPACPSRKGRIEALYSVVSLTSLDN